MPPFPNASRQSLSPLSIRACRAVSLIFQLYLVVPVALYLYHLRRSLGYAFAWAMALGDLWLRFVFFYLFGLTKTEETMHKRPWFRLGEFACGILLCFSFFDR